jgi:hypothetical protein
MTNVVPGRNVRLWHEAADPACLPPCPLMGVKRTPYAQSEFFRM